MNMTKMGRPPITGEARKERYDFSVSSTERARLDALPGSSRANRIMGAIDRRDDVTEVLRELLDASAYGYDTPEFGAAWDRAREVLGETEKEAVR